MNKPNLSSVASMQALTIILAASLASSSLSACEAPKPKGTKTESAATTTTTTTTTAATTGGDTTAAAPDATGTTATNTAPATGTAGDSGANSAAPATAINTASNAAPGTAPAAAPAAAPAGNQVRSELDDLPQLNAVRSVNLSKLKDSVVICTVNGTPITVSSFKTEFHDAVISLQNLLTTQPAKVNQLLNDATAMNIQLTAEENKRLLETAKHKEALEGKSFSDFLKEKKITEAQFNQQVLMLGLAFKTGTRIIESQLLSEIINRELVLQAARSAGMAHLAMNHFIEFKHSTKYNDMLKNSNATAEQIKDELVNHEMIVLMMDQIAKQATLSDADLKIQYDKNKAGFKHGDRLRISHIVVAAPTFDNPPLESIRTQIKRQKPNLTPDELNKEEAVLKVHQQNLANEILARAIKGEDFKTLADKYTDDVQARTMKAGGDLGWVDLSLKVPGANGQKSDQEKLTDAVRNLKSGQVAPNLVQTAFGWHIVKLTDRQKPGLLTFDEVRPSLKQILGQQNKELAEMAWIKDKRKTAQIKVSDEFNQAAVQQKVAATSAAAK